MEERWEGEEVENSARRELVEGAKEDTQSKYLEGWHVEELVLFWVPPTAVLWTWSEN